MGVRVGVFILTGSVLLATLGAAARVASQWGPRADDRRRLLWDSGAGSEGIVLLGDSVFCSYYVASEADTLWARLGRLTGQAVFPGALNGARGRDIRMAAAVVADSWPAGTLVVVQVVPTKLLPLHETAAESLAEEEGNYQRWLDRRVAFSEGEPPLLAFERTLRYTLARSFQVVRYPELTESLGRRALPFLLPAGVERSKHVVWTDRVEGVRRRLGAMLSRIQWERGPVRPAWVAASCAALRAAGLRPLVVVSPFNRDLVARLAGEEVADRLDDLLQEGERMLIQDAALEGVPVLTLRQGIPSECFADFVHTNTCGDDAVARSLAAWVTAGSAAAPGTPPA